MDDISVEANNVANLIDQPKPKPKLKPKICITFNPKEIIKAPYRPLYISTKISGKFSQGVPVDLMCMENVIIEEHLLTRKFHDKFDVIIKTHDGFTCPTHNYITLPIDVGKKYVDVTFEVIPTFDQFQVRLGLPWLTSMKAIASPIHKCLKLPCAKIIMINHIIYKPLASHGNLTLEFI